MVAAAESLKGAGTAIAGLPRVSAVALVLVSVVFMTALPVPRGIAGKAIEDGLKVMRLVPVPDTPTSCGPAGSLSPIDNTPFLRPVRFGVKVMLIVQLAPPARVKPDAGQVLAEMAKSVVSLSAMVCMVIAAVPVFLTVTVCGALVVFTAWLPKPTGLR